MRRSFLPLLVTSLIVWKLVTAAAIPIGARILPFEQRYSLFRDIHYPDFGFGLPIWLTAWGNFDAFYYLGIAKRGYFVSELPFFPLYPFMIAILTQLVKSFPYLFSALIISHLAFITALVISYKLLILDGKRALFPLFLAAVITFPTSYSYGAAYNDSLFFLLATLTLYWARKRRWWLAGVAGALATLTRLNGLALFPFLIAELAKTVRGRGMLADARFHAALLIPGAFAGYLFYIQHVFGSWTKLFTAMSPWGQQTPTFPLQVFWRYAKMLLFTPLTQLVWWVALVELASVLFYLWLLVWSWRKIRLSYWIFFAGSILIPAVTGTFQGMPRYGIHLYPMFLTIAIVLSRTGSVSKFFYVALMTALLIMFAIVFTRGYFLA